MEPEPVTDEGMRHAEARLNQLHAACRAAALSRRKSARHHQQWSEACQAFRAFRAPWDGLWSPDARRAAEAESAGWRALALQFLELRPRAFGTGYLRDAVCHALRRSCLTEPERVRVRRGLLRGLVLCPSVGRYRFDCRLAVKVADDAFLKELHVLSQAKDPWVRGRSRRMLQAMAHAQTMAKG